MPHRDDPAEHVQVAEEVVSWSCYYGECRYDSDCPTRTIKVCAGCEHNIEFEGDTHTVAVLWDAAEQWGHRGEATALIK